MFWDALCVPGDRPCSLGIAGSAGVGGEPRGPCGAAPAWMPGARAAGLPDGLRPAPCVVGVTGRGQTVKEGWKG